MKTMTAKTLTALTLAFAVSGFAMAPVAHAADEQGSNMEKVVMKPSAPVRGGASDVVRGFYGTLVTVMKEGDNLQFKGRYDKLKGAIDRAFNTQEMMRMAAGPSWVKVAPEQKSQLVNAFRSFSVANYASQFKRYDGEKFEVVGEKKDANGNTIVETRLSSGSDTHDLNYLMRKGSSGWQIVDVYVNGTISEMATRRSEFGSVLRASGPEALVDLLDQKSKAMGES